MLRLFIDSYRRCLFLLYFADKILIRNTDHELYGACNPGILKERLNFLHLFITMVEEFTNMLKNDDKSFEVH